MLIGDFVKKKLFKNIDIFIILLVSIVVLWILFFRGYTVGHDSKFHIGNIIELTNQLRSNFFFPSRVYGTMANDFGYGTGIFYPMLSHLSAAYINLVINNPLTSIKIIYFIGLFLSGLTMYGLSKRVSKDNKIALLSAVIYMVFPYHLSNIYIRDALAESTLFIFLPMILSGVYELFKGSKKKFYLFFMIGYIGGVLSHLTMMIYFTILILIFLIIRFKDTIKNIKHFILASIIILLVISPFVIPMVENKLLGNYRVFQDLVMVQGTWGNGLIPYRYFDFSVNNSNEIRYYIDIVCLVLLVISIINYKKYRNKIYDYVIIFGIISIVLTTILFPWDIFPRSFRMFQYPWRFETFAAVFISLVAPLCIKDFKVKNAHYILIALMVWLSIGNTNWNNYSFIDLNDESIYEVSLGWQKEYLPVKTYENIDYYNNRSNDIIIKDNSCDVNIILNEVPSLEFSVSGECTLEFPRLHYTGYSLKNENGNKYEIYENENGFIEVKVNSGTYYLDYTGTTLDNVCKYLNVIGLIGLGVILFKKEV